MFADPCRSALRRLTPNPHRDRARTGPCVSGAFVLEGLPVKKVDNPTLDEDKREWVTHRSFFYIKKCTHLWTVNVFAPNVTLTVAGKGVLATLTEEDLSLARALTERVGGHFPRRRRWIHKIGGTEILDS